MTQFLLEESKEVVSLTEGSGDKKKLFIEGVFMQAEKKNHNGRIYPKHILAREIGNYIREYVEKNRACGELNHPEGPTVNPERISHKIVKIEESGNDYYGKAQVLDTPCGRILKGLLEGGVQVGVSSRGLGSLKEQNGANVVQNDFRLSCVDVVFTPSAPDAYVQGIMESHDWVWDNGLLKPKSIEESKKRIQKAKAGPQLERVMLEEFEKFLSEASLNEGEKTFNLMNGIGKSKYVVNFHDGKKAHKDGSAFYDIMTFKNKVDRDSFVAGLKKKGYREK